MKFVLAILVANLPSLVCVIGAILMAIKSIPAWPWFLLLAVLLAQSIEST